MRNTRTKPAANRTPADHMLPAEREKLAGMLVRFMTIAGAETIRATTGISGTKSMWYEFNLDTPLGPLAVHFTSDGNHLHCRFDDVPRAFSAMAGSINQHSGKYNEYVFQRCTAKHALEEILLPHLRRIWFKAARKILAQEENSFGRYIEACAWMASFRKWNQTPHSITNVFGLKDAFCAIERIIDHTPQSDGENKEVTKPEMASS